MAESCSACAKADGASTAEAIASAASRNTVRTKSHEKKPIAVHGTRSFHPVPVSRTAQPLGRNAKQATRASAPAAWASRGKGASKRSPMYTWTSNRKYGTGPGRQRWIICVRWGHTRKVQAAGRRAAGLFRAAGSVDGDNGLEPRRVAVHVHRTHDPLGAAHHGAHL